MTGEVYDDLDGGEEDLAGYRSLLRGGRPVFRGAATWAQERDLIVEQLRSLGQSDGRLGGHLRTDPGPGGGRHQPAGG